MKTKTNLPAVLAMLALLLTITSPLSTAFAQGTTAFSYQGQLRDGGTNANGVYTMIFKLYDAASGGNQIGGTLTATPTLANGLFTVNLDFGAGAFDGSARWLDITVQSGADSETLAPRVPVQPSPYAIYASSAASAANLSSGTWNASAGNYQGYTNVFGIFANNSLVLGMSTNGCMMNGHLDVNGLGVNGEIDGVDSLNFDNGAAIAGGGEGGFNINGNLGDFSAGNITANSLNLTSDLNVSGSILLPGTNGVSGIYSDGNGGLTFNDGAAAIDRTGHITTLAGININNTTTMDASGNIQADWLNCLGVNASIGISCSYLNASGVISAQSFVTTSDRNLKEKFTPIDNQEILERVASLPISSWNFKNDPATRHIGPMAQDFYSTFNVGPDDKHIATVDEGGVALAAIQGLNRKLDEKDAELQQLKSQNESLEKRLAELEALVKASADK
ncbi:MAG TPA: tail fiber domain-containing protein [Verrucomicrobiae bacterium]|nr:tail fiber domain-containing protein [Verrucomicrobiae bacterium]